MAALTGQDGTITVGVAGATTVVSVKNWSADINVDDIDITSMDSDGHKVFAPGLDEFTLDFEAVLDSTQSTAALQPGAAGTITATSAGSAPFVSMSGGGYIKSLKPKVDMKGEVSISGQWRGSGEYTFGVTAGG